MSLLYQITDHHKLILHRSGDTNWDDIMRQAIIKRFLSPVALSAFLIRLSVLEIFRSCRNEMANLISTARICHNKIDLIFVEDLDTMKLQI